MDLMTRRRALLARVESISSDYITDGLVLWLDGIDKGSTPNCWTDKIFGHVFTANNGVTFGPDSIFFDATRQQYLENQSFDTPSVETGTIEVVFKDVVVTDSGCVYYANQNRKLGFRMYNSGICRILWSSGQTKPMPRLRMDESQVLKVVSISFGNYLINGAPPISIDSDAYIGETPTGINYIGRYPDQDAYFNGSIHSIRMYNRALSADEMLNNQKVDNDRFNLGLII